MMTRVGRPPVDAALVTVFFALAFWFVFVSLAAQWFDDPNYTHGIFVIPMAGILAWRRRDAYRRAPSRASPSGLAIVLAGVALYLAGILAAELFATRVALVVTFWGLFMVYEGSARFRVMLLPLLFLLAMIPLPYVIYYKLTFPLQLLSTRMAAGSLSALGLPLVRMGNVIHLESYSLEVIAACSGLRSIMTLGTMALFLGDFLSFTVPARLLFLALVIPIAILANALRLVTTATLAALAGPAAAEGFLHSASGVIVFLFGMIALILMGKVLRWKPARRG